MSTVQRRQVLRWVRVLLAVAIVAGVVYAFVDQWPRVRPQLAKFDAGHLVFAFAAIVVALAASMMSWRAMLDELGSRLGLRDAARIYFVGQLGKYLPGSVWPAVVQMEMGRTVGVPRARMGVSFVLALAISLLTGALIGLPTLLSTGRYLIPALVLIALVAPVLAFPRLLGAALNTGLRVIRRPPLPQPLRRKGIAKVVGFAAIGWVAYGIQTWVLALDLGAAPARALPVAIGAYAIALVLGVVVVLAPAGVGVREVMLIVGLATVLPAGAATALAVVSRALVTFADVAAAATGLFLRRRVRDGSSVPDGAVATPGADKSQRP